MEESLKKVIIRPIISEKTLALANGLNQYAFKVNKDANKIEVKQAVAAKFNVKVVNVKMINVLGKKVRFGKDRSQGMRSTFKKALVTLQKGGKISIFEIK